MRYIYDKTKSLLYCSSSANRLPTADSETPCAIWHARTWRLLGHCGVVTVDQVARRGSAKSMATAVIVIVTPPTTLTSAPTLPSPRPRVLTIENLVTLYKFMSAHVVKIKSDI